VQFARRQDVLFWPLRAVGAQGATGA
jgi:hypothetical protein